MDWTFSLSLDAQSVATMVNTNDDTDINEDIYAEAKYQYQGDVDTNIINELNKNADIKVFKSDDDIDYVKSEYDHPKDVKDGTSGKNEDNVDKMSIVTIAPQATIPSTTSLSLNMTGPKMSQPASTKSTETPTHKSTKMSMKHQTMRTKKSSI